jgi:hypothetical protein
MFLLMLIVVFLATVGSMCVVGAARNSPPA